jgi:hypothetical protein
MYVSIALVVILLVRMGLAFHSKKCCYEVRSCHSGHGGLPVTAKSSHS